MTEVAKLNDSKTVAKPEDVEVDATPGPLMKKINALKNVQLKMVEIESKFFEELHILECKYAHLYEPLFEKRRQIVVGDYEPNEEEGKWKLDELNDEGATNGEVKENGKPKLDIDEKNLSESGKKLLSDLKAAFDPKNKNGAGDKDEKGIPNFWLETLQSFRITAEIIQEHDEPILAFLQDIRVILADKKPYGYTLEFHFAENPYFTNKVLTKTYELKTEVDEKDPFSYEGPDLEKAIGCKIDWKAGKNVTVKMTKKKLKSKNKKVPPKVITKEEKQDSFFNFFETPKGQEKKPKSPASSGAEDSKKDSDKKIVKHMGDDEDEEDEDAQEELYMIADFEIGQYLREKVIPKAILYYTGELDGLEEDYDDYEDDEDEDGEEDEDDDEEEDDDDDDDDDDEEDKKGPKGKKHAHGKANGPKGGFKTGGKPGEPTPNECKQN